MIYNIFFFHRRIISFNMCTDESLANIEPMGEDASCRLSREPRSVATSCNKSRDSLTSRIESIKRLTFKCELEIGVIRGHKRNYFQNNEIK